MEENVTPQEAPVETVAPVQEPAETVPVESVEHETIIEELKEELVKVEGEIKEAVEELFGEDPDQDGKDVASVE